MLAIIFVIHNGTRSAINNIGQLLLCHAAGFSSPLDSKPYIVKIKSPFISFYLHNITYNPIILDGNWIFPFSQLTLGIYFHL